jgi:uncharacterized protein YecE (DUF72 family)
MKNWYFGTSGLVLPVPNKSHYPAKYQSGSRLHYYGSLFNSIEINSTFYRLPRPGTIIKWADEVPDHFRFTFKAPSAVTHQPELKFNRQELISFMDIIKGVGSKKGFVLLQVPAKMQANARRLARILAIIKKSEWSIAFESRNTTWYEKEVEKVLNDFGVVRVIHDWWSFKIPIASSDSRIYLRFHGPEKNYRGNYSDMFLKDCAIQIRKWLKERRTVYAYFNNTLGNVSGNLQTLIEEV